MAEETNRMVTDNKHGQEDMKTYILLNPLRNFRQLAGRN